MGRSALLFVDAVINLVLGVLLAVFPANVGEFFGAPPAEPTFYPSILGAVLFGIGIALIVEWRGVGESSGLGLWGAIAINLCGGAMLGGWLLFGGLPLEARGLITLWALVGILVSISLFEMAASSATVKRALGPRRALTADRKHSERVEQGQTMQVRDARPDDAARIAEIYNQGIEDRVSTFETRLRTPEEVAQWLNNSYPIVVVEHNDSVIAYAATFAYSSRPCYHGIADFAVYVDRNRRGSGAGRSALTGLYNAARGAGFWKLVSRIFPENEAVRHLNASLGIREVGVHHKHAQFQGAWRDVIVVEWLIAENAV